MYSHTGIQVYTLTSQTQLLPLLWRAQKFVRGQSILRNGLFFAWNFSWMLRRCLIQVGGGGGGGGGNVGQYSVSYLYMYIFCQYMFVFHGHANKVHVFWVRVMNHTKLFRYWTFHVHQMYMYEYMYVSCVYVHLWHYVYLMPKFFPLNTVLYLCTFTYTSTCTFTCIHVPVHV